MSTAFPSSRGCCTVHRVCAAALEPAVACNLAAPGCVGKMCWFCCCHLQLHRECAMLRHALLPDPLHCRSSGCLSPSGGCSATCPAAFRQRYVTAHNSIECTYYHQALHAQYDYSKSECTGSLNKMPVAVPVLSRPRTEAFPETPKVVLGTFTILHNAIRDRVTEPQMLLDLTGPLAWFGFRLFKGFFQRLRPSWDQSRCSACPRPLVCNV